MFSSVGSGNDEEQAQLKRRLTKRLLNDHEQWWAAGAKEMGKVVAVGDFSGLSKCRY